jgi:hypothetical protein
MPAFCVYIVMCKNEKEIMSEKVKIQKKWEKENEYMREPIKWIKVK